MEQPIAENESPIGTLLHLAHIPHDPSSYPNIIKLDLFQCGLSTLPEEISTLLPNLNTLFCMKNIFTQVPAVIGACPNLQMVSFKSNRVASIHPDALQKQMRWLILTDNSLTSLPDTIGQCVNLQKLMLSGNQLSALPDSIIRCQKLELIRLASNQLNTSPIRWLCQLPKLAWVAFSDNPFLHSHNNNEPSEKNTNLIHLEDDHPHMNGHVFLDEAQLYDTGEILGSGASGITRKFIWNQHYPHPKQLPVAVKTFSSSLTSDGNPMQERRIALMTCYSKSLDGLVQVLGVIPSTGCLVMELLQDYIVFAQPPSMQSCTRDIYEYYQYPDKVLISTVHEAQEMITKLLLVMNHLHVMGICHGDFYGHNILVLSPTTTTQKTILDDGGCCNSEVVDPVSLHVKLTDFGASFIYNRKSDYGEMIECIEVRAFGHLLSEIRNMLIHVNKMTPSNEMNIVQFCSSLQDFIQYCHGESKTSFTQLMHLWNNSLRDMNVACS